MTPAAAYMRCSSKTSLDGDTWDRQRDTIQRCAASLDYSVTYEFREEAVPGKTEEADRPAFQDMISTLLSNGCRTIIIESLDRLAREYRIQEQLIIYIASKGLVLIAANTGENITEAMLGDPMRRALVQIQGVLAELDKNMIIAKLRKARERVRMATGKCEGRKKYGEWPYESEVLSTILKLHALGAGPKVISESLNEFGIPTRYGRPWFSATVSKILKRQVIIPKSIQ